MIVLLSSVIPKRDEFCFWKAREGAMHKHNNRLENGGGGVFNC